MIKTLNSNQIPLRHHKFKVKCQLEQEPPQVSLMLTNTKPQVNQTPQANQVPLNNLSLEQLMTSVSLPRKDLLTLCFVNTSLGLVSSRLPRM